VQIARTSLETIGNYLALEFINLTQILEIFIQKSPDILQLISNLPLVIFQIQSFLLNKISSIVLSVCIINNAFDFICIAIIGDVSIAFILHQFREQWNAAEEIFVYLILPQILDAYDQMQVLTKAILQRKIQLVCQQKHLSDNSIVSLIS